MGRNNAGLFEEIRSTKRNLNLLSQAILTALTTFTYQFNAFLILAEQMESDFKEMEVREAAMDQLVLEMKGKTHELEERERKYVVIEKELKMKHRIVKENKEKWTEIERGMKQNAAKLPTVVHLNVSGSRFSVSKEKLLQHKGSLFERMMMTNHSQQLPSTGEIFIERDPELFKHVVRFLVDGTLPAPSKSLQNEFEYFKIPFGLPVIQTVPPPNLKSTHQIQSALLKRTSFANNITEWLPKRNFQLLYKATVDGFSSASFHKKCDNKGSTLTLIRSNNRYLFGGYSVPSWDSTTSYKDHVEGFLFTFSNPHNLPPTKYSRYQQNPHAICCHPSYGPTFGGGCDLYVADNSHQNNQSCIWFPYSYVDTTGKGRNTFTGADLFTTSDIEVFSII